MSAATVADHTPYHHRMVVFLGPHKSASSSVQELFMQYASADPNGNQTHHPSLVNWTWPWNIRRRSYLPRKGFAPLVTENLGFQKVIWNTMLQVWNETTTSQDPTYDSNHHAHSQHMIWGSEELDRFGPTPWSHRDGIRAIREVVERMPPSHLDLVVNYRRPRRDQWISIWKQLYRGKAKTKFAYPNFVCDPKEQERIWEYLDCVANPLGLTAALLEAFPSPAVTVHLLDMQGIAALQRDVGHILACDVLQVPCTEQRWLPNIEHPILQNSRSGNPDLSESQLEDMEWILRQRDCSYRNDLQRHLQRNNESSTKRLSLHYADTLWEGCTPTDASDNDALSIIERLARNTTWLLEVLQSQVGCGSMTRTAIGDLRRNQQTTEGRRRSTDRVSVPPAKTLSLNTTLTTGGKKSPALESFEMPNDKTTDVLDRVATAPVAILYMLILSIIGNLLRRLKCRGLKPHRRLAGRRQLAGRGA